MGAKTQKRVAVSRESPISEQQAAAACGVDVVDFFCGCGGTSSGFEASGMNITAGVDNDPDATASFHLNFPEASVFSTDIATVSAAKIEAALPESSRRVSLFSACAPCQPFTKQRAPKKKNDIRVPLLAEFSRFIVELTPDLVFVENVPGLQLGVGTKKPFGAFLRTLRSEGYHVEFDVINCERFGVPQRRRRLLLMASRLGPVALPEPTHGHGSGLTLAAVWDFIGDLPPLEAGGTNSDILDHEAMNLSPTNLQRIASTPPDGTRLAWPPSLELACHAGSHKGHTDVYGRMPRDRPAPALTTRCVSLSNGRFGHPEQNRAISVREAASLQTFPRDYRFAGSLTSRARQIGNAVPVLLARRVGETFRAHIADHLA